MNRIFLRDIEDKIRNIHIIRFPKGKEKEVMNKHLKKIVTEYHFTDLSKYNYTDKKS